MQRHTVDVDGQIRTVVDLRGDQVVLRDADVYFRDLGPYERWVKPVIDLVGAAVLIVIFAPVMLACAIAVYISLDRPVILKQPRVGRGGKIFNVYKFRTMEPDRRTARGPFNGQERRVSHKRPDDPRLTPTGEFLRKWSLDELPQFFNVLRGEMSLVGPRPELVAIVANYEQWQHERHAVRPGITCLWQISERGDRMLHEATELDLQYLRELSIRTDLSILIRTPFAMLGMRPGS